MMDQITASGAALSPGLGLQVDGTEFKLNGNKFRGIGVNHFSLLLNSIMDMGIGGISTTQPAIDLQTIKQTYGIPFVKFSIGGFSRASWLQWYNNKPAWYSAMDGIVESAERFNIGLIPALAWNLRALSDITFDIHGGVSDGPSKFATKTSNAWLLFASFVTDIVNRYKNSPAIWGWCISNETQSSTGPEYFSTWALDGTTHAFLNWGTKSEGGNYAVADKMSRIHWTEFTRNAIELIRSLDNTGRAIFPGAGLGTSFAVNTQTTNTLTADTLAQWNSAAFGMPWIALRDQSFDVIESHIYPQTLGNSQFYNGGEKTAAELIALHKGWADQVKKPFYLAEFGATYWGDSVDQTSVDLASETSNFNAALAAVLENDVQLSSVWNYDGALAGASAWQRWKLNDTSRRYQLDAIAAANANF